MASEGRGDPWGCGRKLRGCRVPAAETAEARVMERRWRRRSQVVLGSFETRV